jgi:hypothetical protein
MRTLEGEPSIAQLGTEVRADVGVRVISPLHPFRRRRNSAAPLNTTGMDFPHIPSPSIRVLEPPVRHAES